MGFITAHTFSALCLNRIAIRWFDLESDYWISHDLTTQRVYIQRTHLDQLGGKTPSAQSL